MLTGSLLALQAAKGIYHVKEAIASSTLQIALCIHTHTHTYCTHSHKHARWRAGPFHLTALCGRKGIYSPWQWHSVVLLEMELSPFNLPRCLRAGPHWASCAVTFMSYKQPRGEKQINPATTHSTQPNAGRCFLYLLILDELQIILYSSVSQMNQQYCRCRARLICFAQCWKWLTQCW